MLLIVIVFFPYLLRSISGELPSSASSASWLCCRKKVLLPCTGCSTTVHVHGLLDPAAAWLSASDEDVTQLSVVERCRGGDSEREEEEEDRHPVSTADASSESSALAAGEPRLWSARTSCARRSTDCRYLPCASILSCR